MSTTWKPSIVSSSAVDFFFASPWCNHVIIRWQSREDHVARMCWSGGFTSPYGKTSDKCAWKFERRKTAETPPPRKMSAQRSRSDGSTHRMEIGTKTASVYP